MNYVVIVVFSKLVKFIIIFLNHINLKIRIGMRQG
ncbi:MAG: hypothetical protein K0S80_797 [Neobacillus sp.]|nr:hypothetical protein [Neobacillus sp.]